LPVPSVLCPLTTCQTLPSPPPPLFPLRSSPRTGPRRQHRSFSPVAKTRRLSLMPRRRRGVDESRSRERRSNARKRQSDERVKRRRPEHERRRRGPRRRQNAKPKRRWSARRVSRRRRTGRRCSGGLQRSLRGREHWRRRHRRKERGKSRRRVRVVTRATTPGKYFILYPLLLFINFLAGVSAV